MQAAESSVNLKNKQKRKCNENVNMNWKFTNSLKNPAFNILEGLAGFE